MNQKRVVLFAVIAGGLALAWFLKKDREPTFSEAVHEAALVAESSDSMSEEEITLNTGPQNVQVTEIPSHGEDRANQSRRLQAPRSAPTAVKPPDERKLAQATVLSGTSWKLWEGVTAYAKGAAQDRLVLTEISGFDVVEEDSFRADERNFSSDRPLVVFNERKKIAGIVTGVVQVILREGYTIESLAMASSLRVTGSHPEMRMYFVTAFENPFDLSDLKERLSRDPAVQSVDLEVLSRKYEKY